MRSRTIQNCLLIFIGFCVIIHRFNNSIKDGTLNGEIKSPNIIPWNTSQYSHPLENSCKYPILDPHDPSISGYFFHPRQLVCKKIQPEFTTLNDSGYLHVHEDVTLEPNRINPLCFYRPLTGSLKPDIEHSNWALDKWTRVEIGKPTKIEFDQFVVKCLNVTAKKFEFNTDGLPDQADENVIYHRSYAHFPLPQDSTKFADAKPQQLSINILVIDSTSLSSFRRHAPRSWKYMTDVMGFEWLQGYNKVADNSMVNLMPVLAGLRYVNQSDHFPSDIFPQSYDETVLDLDNMDFVWKDMINSGCVSMWNDDIGDVTRGLFHYPSNQVRGFVSKPTDYYFRPWHVYNYRNLIRGSSNYCMANQRHFEQVVGLTESFMRKFAHKCHFSFTFFTDLTHADPSKIELMDDYFYWTLNRLYRNALLNNSALIVMGDHGNRISKIRFSFIGSFEERLPFFSVYLPEWFRKQNPQLMNNLRTNRQRLTSNYDVWQLLKELVSGSWSERNARPSGKGISLLRPIPAVRSCSDANIPEQYCSCLVREREVKLNSTHGLKAFEAFGNWSSSLSCYDNQWQMQPIAIELLTMSQMVRHGIRYQTPTEMRLLKAKAFVDYFYLELVVKITISMAELNVKSRFVYEVETEKVSMNLEPLIIKNTHSSCWWAKTLQDYCVCTENY